jgi:hypothetical protein
MGATLSIIATLVVLGLHFSNMKRLVVAASNSMTYLDIRDFERAFKNQPIHLHCDVSDAPDHKKHAKFIMNPVMEWNHKEVVYAMQFSRIIPCNYWEITQGIACIERNSNSEVNFNKILIAQQSQLQTRAQFPVERSFMHKLDPLPYTYVRFADNDTPLWWHLLAYFFCCIACSSYWYSQYFNKSVLRTVQVDISTHFTFTNDAMEAFLDELKVHEHDPLPWIPLEHTSNEKNK